MFSGQTKLISLLYLSHLDRIQVDLLVEDSEYFRPQYADPIFRAELLWLQLLFCQFQAQ